MFRNLIIDLECSVIDIAIQLLAVVLHNGLASDSALSSRACSDVPQCWSLVSSSLGSQTPPTPWTAAEAPCESCRRPQQEASWHPQRCDTRISSAAMSLYDHLAIWSGLYPNTSPLVRPLVSLLVLLSIIWPARILQEDDRRHITHN